MCKQLSPADFPISIHVDTLKESFEAVAAAVLLTDLLRKLEELRNLGMFTAGLNQFTFVDLPIFAASDFSKAALNCCKESLPSRRLHFAGRSAGSDRASPPDRKSLSLFLQVPRKSLSTGVFKSCIWPPRRWLPELEAEGGVSRGGGSGTELEPGSLLDGSGTGDKSSKAMASERVRSMKPGKAAAAPVSASRASAVMDSHESFDSKKAFAGAWKEYLRRMSAIVSFSRLVTPRPSKAENQIPSAARNAKTPSTFDSLEMLYDLDHRTVTLHAINHLKLSAFQFCRVFFIEPVLEKNVCVTGQSMR
eukprot:CAMPEP_0197697680 /NCGR_PEP_ID=MMETSP1338-20131121/118283_1 /TAXON_ID=43686 ORGANISM="Pelagodinium beii, Strain RCC1491" /NCGR_SAMPLE_ID=MMETSP1338 /ASSEMBLY_ACC=CAM_ASM_000754 /LENGTH=305 /DNA_ID=CAMNT_0043280951 /DNA_START=70 /DNA_END=987 /DNA_ORIENTATION=-